MYAAEFGHRDWTDVLVVTHPISRTAQAAVIPFPVRDQYTDQFPYEDYRRMSTSESPTGEFPQGDRIACPDLGI